MKQFIKKWWKILLGGIIILGCIIIYLFNPNNVKKILSKQIEDILSMFKTQNDITKVNHAVIDNDINNVNVKIKNEKKVKKEKKINVDDGLEKLYKKHRKNNEKT